MDKDELIDFMKWLEDDHYSNINCLLDGEFTCDRNLISQAYIKQKLNLSGIVRPASEGAEGAAVGKERGAQSQCDGIKHSPFSIKGLDGIIRCADCGTQLYPRGTP